jgi:hypothetical protein
MPPGLGELTKLVQQSRKSHPMPAPIEPARVPTRALRRRFAPQKIEELVTRYTAGEAIRALSREYSVSRSGLRQLLRGEDVALREQGITPEDAERAVRLYETGLTIRQVVEKVGSSYGTIQRMLNEKGVVLRAGGRATQAAMEEQA